LEEIQVNVDPVLLTRCRTIFRQEVSFFRRSYMAAYLLLQAEGAVSRDGSTITRNGGAVQREGGAADTASGGGRENDSRSRRREQRESRSRTEANAAEGSRALGDDESVRLFVGIGRNRKVFPREIIALINAKAQVARDDIGTIRILDNYSFVQVRISAADAVIEALNGQMFRGRTLTVNYARRREEEDDLPEDT